MIKFYSINGTLVPADQAQIGVTDLALLRAFAVFDYFRFVKGKPVFMDDHLERFRHSASLMGLEIPYSEKELKKLISELVKANGLPDVGIHMILTGGYSEDGFSPSKPNLILLERPFVPQPESKFKNGVKLLFWQYKRELPEVKSINYIIPVLSLKQREAAGAAEILYHDGEYISECSRSNIFMVTHENVLATVEKDVLKGVSRKHTIEVAKDVYKVELRDITIEEVKNAKEVFLTNTSQRIMPVVAIDDFVIGDGKPGRVTLELSKMLHARIEGLMAKTQTV